MHNGWGHMPEHGLLCNTFTVITNCPGSSPLPSQTCSQLQESQQKIKRRTAHGDPKARTFPLQDAGKIEKSGTHKQSGNPESGCLVLSLFFSPVSTSQNSEKCKDDYMKHVKRQNDARICKNCADAGENSTKEEDLPIRLSQRPKC